MADILRLASDTAGTTIAVGSNGLILRTVDGGATWATIPSGVTNGLYGVAWGLAFGYAGWAIVGENGLILISDTGEVWTLVTPIVSESLFAMTFAGVFIAVGEAGTIIVSDDLGATWEEKSSGTTEDLIDINAGSGLYTIVGTNDTVIVGSLTTLAQEVYLEERVRMTPLESETGKMGHVTSESFDVLNPHGWTHISGAITTEGGQLQYDTITELAMSLDIGGGVAGGFNHTVTELYGILPSLLSIGTFQHVLSEQANIPHTASQTYRITRLVLEQLVATNILTSLHANTIREIVSLLTPTAGSGNFRHGATETVTLRDSVLIAWLALLEEQVTATDSAARRFEIALTMVERLTATNTVTSRLQAMMTIALALELIDTVASGKGAEAIESVTLTPEALQRIYAVALALETATMTATPEMTLRLSIPVTDKATLTSSSTARGIFRDLLADGVAFELLFTAGGETYRGWVMNTENFGVTEYQDYPFNSLTKFNGVYLGANSNGVYSLTGGDDAGDPITASIKTGVNPFPAKTNIPEVFLSFRSDGGMLIKTITDEKIERWYSVTGTENISRKRAKMANGVKSSFWQFELTNVDGASLEFESLEIVPVVLSRKI